MAVRGQKFNLDLDADDFQFDLQDDLSHPPLETFHVVREIQERESTAPPPPPQLKSRSGFPEHRPRPTTSKFKQQRKHQTAHDDVAATSLPHGAREPSDRAIAHHIGQKYGVDTEAKEKAQISAENKDKLAAMSTEEIEQARAELMSGLNPALIRRLLSRANIDQGHTNQGWEDEALPMERDSDSQHQGAQSRASRSKGVKFGSPGGTLVDDVHGSHLTKEDDPMGEHVVSQSRRMGEPRQHEEATTAVCGIDDEERMVNPLHQDSSSGEPQGQSDADVAVHFPIPPRNAAAFPDLDPDSATFLEDLRSNYFPDTPHDPNSLTWLQDLTEEEKNASPYAASQHAYAPSDIRFDFAGRLIPPSESETIPVYQGLHHHGNAPNSAGYSIPELGMLCRSSLPNQRCIAYQTLGRILYRLGRGDFGPKGTELNEGLWSCIEHERPLEVVMTEANRKGGHISASTYATEALWLWRKGGGGDRGILKDGQRIVR